MIRWKLFPAELGGGKQHLTRYKEAWIVFNRNSILAAAAANRIRPELLASVAFIEVGGDPDVIDNPAFLVRSFDWSGPPWADRMAITRRPEFTSFGAVSIQLRTAARELGLDASRMSFSEQMPLRSCLQQDSYNLHIVAKHLRSLIIYDYPNADTLNLTEEQFIVAGARYNRGTERALSDIVESISLQPGSEGREYSSYGRTMIRHRSRIKHLLGIL